METAVDDSGAENVLGIVEAAPWPVVSAWAAARAVAMHVGEETALTMLTVLATDVIAKIRSGELRSASPPSAIIAEESTGGLASLTPTRLCKMTLSEARDLMLATAENAHRDAEMRFGSDVSKIKHHVSVAIANLSLDEIPPHPIMGWVNHVVVCQASWWLTTMNEQGKLMSFCGIFDEEGDPDVLWFPSSEHIAASAASLVYAAFNLNKSN